MLKVVGEKLDLPKNMKSDGICLIFRPANIRDGKDNRGAPPFVLVQLHPQVFRKTDFEKNCTFVLLIFIQNCLYLLSFEQI